VSRVSNQRRLFGELVEELRPHWRKDAGQPRRLAEWLARHRAGSRDRRLYRELTYTLWRILPWVEDAAAETLLARVANHAENNRATAEFIAAFADPKLPDPAPASTLLPDWLINECPALAHVEERDCLLSRAPLWLRQQGETMTQLTQTFPEAEPSSHVPHAWKLPTKAPVTASELYRQGGCEIQDVGSQALLQCLPEFPGGQWLDACAGAGGKSLQLASLLRSHSSEGRVTAHDIRPVALRELELRRQRAGFDNLTITKRVQGTFDAVLVDAPCSGSGTWRRSPHLKWTTRPGDLVRLHDRQIGILEDYATHVAEGGLLIYATCSLCRTENESVAEAFLSAHAHFRPAELRHPVSGAAIPGGQLTLLPALLDSDGYFLAAFRRS